jgi:hypothetical protein
VLNTLKSAVVAPMATAIVVIATIVNAGDLKRLRSACLTAQGTRH